MKFPRSRSSFRMSSMWVIPCISLPKPSARFPLTAVLPYVVDSLLHTMITRRLNTRARRPRFHIPLPVILRRLCSLTNSTWSLPNSLWAVPFLLLTSKVNFLMPPMRTTMWSSSGNRFASRCLIPSLAYIISSTRFTTTLSTNAPRYSYHHAQTYAPISWTRRPQTMDALGWNPMLAPLHLSSLRLLQRHVKNETAG